MMYLGGIERDQCNNHTCGYKLGLIILAKQTAHEINSIAEFLNFLLFLQLDCVKYDVFRKKKTRKKKARKIIMLKTVLTCYNLCRIIIRLPKLTHTAFGNENLILPKGLDCKCTFPYPCKQLHKT